MLYGNYYISLDQRPLFVGQIAIILGKARYCLLGPVPVGVLLPCPLQILAMHATRSQHGVAALWQIFIESGQIRELYSPSSILHSWLYCHTHPWKISSEFFPPTLYMDWADSSKSPSKYDNFLADMELCLYHTHPMWRYI